jgi:hypothetical protein
MNGSRPDTNGSLSRVNGSFPNMNGSLSDVNGSLAARRRRRCSSYKAISTTRPRQSVEDAFERLRHGRVTFWRYVNTSHEYALEFLTRPDLAVWLFTHTLE